MKDILYFVSPMDYHPLVTNHRIHHQRRTVDGIVCRTYYRGKSTDESSLKDPWENVGSGMRLDGKKSGASSLASSIASNGIIEGLSEEEQLQLALQFSLEPEAQVHINPQRVRIRSFRYQQNQRRERRVLLKYDSDYPIIKLLSVDS